MRPSRTAWLPLVVLFGTVFVGVFAPVLANDVPLAARVDGSWSFPAVADLFGEPPPGPRDLTWRAWRASLDAGSDDAVVMPPWPHGPLETDAERFSAVPSLAHPLGNDDTGRDVLARLVHGARTAVVIALPTVLIAAVIGTLLGAWAGLARGIVDVVLMRLVELLLCFPTLLFLLFAAAFLSSSVAGLTAVMAALFWIAFARIVRGELLSLRERDFVLVARGLGVSPMRIAVRHLLPQVVGQVRVTAAFCLAAAVVAESTLSFLGLGPNTESSWGDMLRTGSAQAAAGAWHLWLFPTLALVVFVVACHRLADRGGRPAP